ncbi:GspH/FimT family pseudopilin [Massilia sp. HP4]|uniref:GspH/FimT family pseudopilin n=1 Tax=Massilia sp. HP4 TaxID=2562316 RepID=UPI0010C028EC|nr:GspH/FimT family pseudopilin [Massilia sp. HP4]
MSRVASGYTLLELLMVVVVLSIAAVVAIPSSAPMMEVQAETATGEVALALRLARDDARRSGQQRLVSCDPGAGTVTVRAVSTEKDTTSPSGQPIYVVALDSEPAGSTMTLVSCSFTFDDNGTAATVVFDASGDPVRGIGKGPVRDKALRAGAIVLGAGHVRRNVNLGATGRITQS